MMHGKIFTETFNLETEAGKCNYVNCSNISVESNSYDLRREKCTVYLTCMLLSLWNFINIPKALPKNTYLNA